MANDQNQLDRINHIVVLMMENRSFDNVPGWLYDGENKPPRDQKFEGVFGKNLSNKHAGGVRTDQSWAHVRASQGVARCRRGGRINKIG